MAKMFVRFNFGVVSFTTDRENYASLRIYSGSGLIDPTVAAGKAMVEEFAKTFDIIDEYGRPVEDFEAYAKEAISINYPNQ